MFNWAAAIIVVFFAMTPTYGADSSPIDGELVGLRAIMSRSFGNAGANLLLSKMPTNEAANLAKSLLKQLNSVNYPILSKNQRDDLANAMGRAFLRAWSIGDFEYPDSEVIFLPVPIRYIELDNKFVLLTISEVQFGNFKFDRRRLEGILSLGQRQGFDTRDKRRFAPQNIFLFLNDQEINIADAKSTDLERILNLAVESQDNLPGDFLGQHHKINFNIRSIAVVMKEYGRYLWNLQVGLSCKKHFNQ